MAIAIGVIEWRWIGVFFEIAVEYDLITLFIGVDEVEDKSWVSFKPADVFWLAKPRNKRKTRWQPLMQPRDVDVSLQQFRIPKKRKIA